MVFLLCLIVLVVSVRFVVDARKRIGWRRHAPFAIPFAAFVSAIASAPTGLVLMKSVGFLSMPLGLLWLLLLTTSLVAWWTKQRRWALVVGVAAMGLTLAASPALARVLMHTLEGEYADRDVFEESPFDAVIVLGGGTGQTPSGEVQLGQSGDRVLLGARLYRRGLTPALVTSGAPIEGFTQHDSAAASMQIWQELGVPPEAIVRIAGARNTSEEARLHARLARERQWNRVGLVTSALHMRRALALFREQGMSVVPLPADVRGSEPRWPTELVDVLPRASAAATVHVVLWEYLGRLAGR